LNLDCEQPSNEVHTIIESTNGAVANTVSRPGQKNEVRSVPNNPFSLGSLFIFVIQNCFDLQGNSLLDIDVSNYRNLLSYANQTRTKWIILINWY